MAENGQSTSGIRLQSYLSRAGVASRRKCAELIGDGRATVNGIVVVEAASRVQTGDLVTFDGVPITLLESFAYYVLNKPPGFLCAMNDEFDRPLAIDLLKEAIPEVRDRRVYNVGRLDFRSSGLLLFTDDGDFAKVVTHPSSEIEKEYWVRIGAEVNPDELQKFCTGQTVDGVRYSVKEIRPDGFLQYVVTLVEGKNREIRKIFEYLDTRVRELRRIRIGPVLTEGLEECQARKLTEMEISELTAGRKMG